MAIASIVFVGPPQSEANGDVPLNDFQAILNASSGILPRIVQDTNVGLGTQ